ncbi:anthranilate synthase [Bacillus sp. FJAT-18017]|uniref:anthranilate synthase component II n=1 Tax=Bacillus sp. FJAT-18017 TaxID=1705566 RepID=UPI0006AF622F|nr:aminodeoxychorismate/anthranilate synthase component II [Bacillus sp. FJAT-18017]ALC89092.1 anthranilate synthase [Bacillus sp. FJAT-18017]
MILVIDNYDSFTYNLVQYIRGIGEEVLVVRNDQVSLDEIERLGVDCILLSPGPGNPDTAGICLDVVERFSGVVRIAGVCLGQQVIAQAFGGVVRKARRPMHGKVSVVAHDGRGAFRGVRSPVAVARYHSLVVDEESLPDCLEVSARSEDGEIMGLRHKVFAVECVQFHPEAILTEDGKLMVRNLVLG